MVHYITYLRPIAGAGGGGGLALGSSSDELSDRLGGSVGVYLLLSGDLFFFLLFLRLKTYMGEL